MPRYEDFFRRHPRLAGLHVEDARPEVRHQGLRADDEQIRPPRSLSRCETDPCRPEGLLAGDTFERQRHRADHAGPQYGQDNILDATISIDSKQVFKPSPEAYSLVEASGKLYPKSISGQRV
jgi:hypothetical protein